MSQQTLQGLEAGEYAGATKLKISSGDLTTFPLSILSLSSTLEMLDLGGNPHLTSLPSSISQLKKLKIAFFSDCGFKRFPTELKGCEQLEMIAFKGNGMEVMDEDSLPPRIRWLILTNNKLTKLPESFGMERLQKVMVAGNRLSSLPSSMSKCRKLGLLRISSNRFQELPEWLFHLPELAFLSFAGNPCVPTSLDNPTLDSIHWSELSTSTLLGEGASGIISKGTWKSQDVAIKLYKGDVTSDGSPLDEMNACLFAGKHTNLVNPLAKIVGHEEEGKRGLVMELIPDSYVNLGLPPTLDSCTRDAYKAGTVYSVETVVAILRGIASVGTHLHAKGIAHGDLYAHNILISHTGHALLGDFGAATIYTPSHPQASLIQRLEVLAFGHLLEDLLGLTPEAKEGEQEKEKETRRRLRELHEKCVEGKVGTRLSFREVEEELVALSSA